MPRKYRIKNRKKWMAIRRRATSNLWKNPQYALKQSKAATANNLRTWKDPKVRARRIKGLSHGQQASYANPIKGALRRSRIAVGRSRYFADLSQDERSAACAHWYQASFNTKKNTKLEKIVQSLLRKEKIKFIGHKRIGLFVPDLFIKPRICVFVDGKYWHCRPERKRSDRRINRKLKDQGYCVIRLSEHMVKHFPMKCVSKIKEKL